MTINKFHIKPLLQSGYMNQEDAQKAMHAFGYGYDNSLSSMDTKVFVSPDGTPTIVHRGTSNIRDVADDLILTVGLGEYGHRLKNAKRVTEKAEAKYGRAADTIGHSYGGFLGEHSNAKGEIITYNKAVGLADFFKRVPSNQLDIRADKDLVSLLSNTQSGKKTTIPSGYFTAHNLDKVE